MTTPAELTPRQAEVAAMLAKGMTDKRIAGEMGIAHNTVRIYVASIAYRLGFPGGTHTRVMIARWWIARHPDCAHDSAIPKHSIAARIGLNNMTIERPS